MISYAWASFPGPSLFASEATILELLSQAQPHSVPPEPGQAGGRPDSNGHSAKRS